MLTTERSSVVRTGHRELLVSKQLDQAEEAEHGLQPTCSRDTEGHTHARECGKRRGKGPGLDMCAVASRLCCTLGAPNGSANEVELLRVGAHTEAVAKI
jgi:hypothetical protein